MKKRRIPKLVMLNDTNKSINDKKIETVKNILTSFKIYEKYDVKAEENLMLPKVNHNIQLEN